MIDASVLKRDGQTGVPGTIICKVTAGTAVHLLGVYGCDDVAAGAFKGRFAVLVCPVDQQVWFCNH